MNRLVRLVGVLCPGIPSDLANLAVDAHASRFERVECTAARPAEGGGRPGANDGCGAWCGGETTELCRVPRFRVLTAVELEHAARVGEAVLLEQPRCERVERALAEVVREPAE